MNLEERIARLEKLYEKVYHDYELLSIYIPKLTDILNRYWGASGRHREAVRNDIHVFIEFLKEVDHTLQQYMKHHEAQHITASKKKRDTYDYE